jgi:two-component system, NarL family, sensor kinase
MEPTISEFTVMFSIATIGMLVLAMSIVFFVLFYQRKMLEAKLKEQRMEVEHQQKMLQAALESQENERKRLAADLHDGIGAMLSTIRLRLGTLARTEGVPTQDIDQTKTMLDDTITSVRRLSRDLLPSTLQKFGLSHAVKELCEQYTLVSGLSILFSEKGTPREKEPTDQLMIFRIVQELINNAMKHAQPTLILVSLDWQKNFELNVTDDGSGFLVEQVRQSGRGLGLFNMENRARLLNAQLAFSPNQPKGTVATLEIIADR